MISSDIPPEGWELVSISALGATVPNAFATGPFGSAIGSRFFCDQGTPVIRGSNLSTDSAIRLREREFVYLSREKAEEFRRSVVKPGDIVFTCWGTINQIGLIDERARHPEYVLSNKQMKLTPDPNRADAAFLYYLISSPPMQREILQGAIGTSVPGFNLTRLKSLRLRVPGLSEQRRIAEALNDADDLISALERLIAKKEAVKQGMMQELLSGRTRLPGFDGAWVPRRLAVLGSFLKGRGVTRSDLKSTGVPCVRYGELYTAFEDCIAEPLSFVDRDVAETALPLHSGDIVFAASGETRAEIGKCAAYAGPVPAVAGGDTIVLRGHGCSPRFLAALLNSPRIAEKKARAGQGDAVVHISSRSLAAIELDLPPRAEQDAIASVLSDADDELAALRKRLEKAKAVKQGMMQELLTGRTRLPAELEREAEAA